jgi:diguanylate cyclase (GGDEF)-like protein/PAS domain S-box-containing protein
MMPQSQSAFDAATTAVLEAQYASAERIVNGVRLTLLGMLGLAALLWAPHLTSALNMVNFAVLVPLLTWAVVQHVVYHRKGRRSAYISLVNTYIDITAVTALLLGYGLLGMPDLAVKSPIWTAYFLIMSARPFTGSPRRAALAAATVAVQYAAIATFFILVAGLPLLSNPMDSARTSGTSILDETGKLMLLVMAGAVVTYATAWSQKTLRHSVEAMKFSEERFRTVFEHSAVGIALLDAALGITHANAAFEQFLGFAASELTGRCLTDFIPAEDSASPVAMLRQVVSGAQSAVSESRFMRRDGQIGWAMLTVSRADSERELRYIAIVQDVTEHKSLEAQLLHQAFHDPLTDLANRALFRDRVDHALSRTARESGRIAVLFLDLDNFKAVNDTQGHAAGDRLLQTIASRLLKATRGCDTVARLGGDEFGVLLEDVHAGEGAEIVAERIAGAFRAPLETSPRSTTTVSASIGIATPVSGDGTEELLRNADVAMYAAKKRSRGRWIRFDRAMHTAVVDRVTLEADLRRAVERQELGLAYQPIVDLATGRIMGVEALARWTHPERGVVPPLTFIPIAEESDLILSLGRWVLREACRQGAAWNASRPGDLLTITVNVSGVQLEHPGLAADVADALRDSGLPAACLILEITETVITRKTEATVARLHALKGLGVRLAIDDFGTGYSSLSYLQQFPVDVLKIDRAFTEGLLREGNDSALVGTIISLAGTLALRTIAEGVEDASQQDRLRELGCDAAQGFLFSEPMGAEDVEALLAGGAVGVVG